MVVPESVLCVHPLLHPFLNALAPSVHPWASQRYIPRPKLPTLSPMDQTPDVGKSIVQIFGNHHVIDP